MCAGRQHITICNILVNMTKNLVCRDLIARVLMPSLYVLHNAKQITIYVYVCISYTKKQTNGAVSRKYTHYYNTFGVYCICKMYIVYKHTIVIYSYICLIYYVHINLNVPLRFAQMIDCEQKLPVRLIILIKCEFHHILFVYVYSLSLVDRNSGGSTRD